jgi:hypothetical protein
MARAGDPLIIEDLGRQAGYQQESQQDLLENGDAMRGHSGILASK